jgi:hypothetical protein
MQSDNSPTIQVKFLKHSFSVEEKNALGQQLAQRFSERRGKEAEFDQVKASFKSILAEKDAAIENLSTSLVNGFEMRNKPCIVLYRPSEREKDFYLEEGFESKDHSLPVLTEPMTQSDFQQELLQAESRFDKREEIDLFTATERDSGVLAVGMLAGKWYTALRIKIGHHHIDERLDTEQKACRQRFDAITSAGKRALEWMQERLQKDAKGFEDPLLKAIGAHSGRVE